jgi:carboxyl-terminal processing protease
MPPKARQTAILTLTGLAFVAVAFIAGFVARGFTPLPDDSFPLVHEARRLLEEHYLGDLPGSIVLERGMIRGMLQEIGDPFTVYLEPEAQELQTDLLTGEYGGIGAVLSRDQSGRIHLVPIPEGPAALAGVQEGDVLLGADGQTFGPETSLEAVSAALRGTEGTPVEIRIAPRQPGDPEIRLTILRRVFPLPSVAGYLLPDDPTIGVLVITVFSDKTPRETEDAYASLRQRGAERFILDLRGNPGGLLDSGIATARYFMDSGVVVTEQQRDNARQTYQVDTPGPAARVPLAVTVDSATASAAEIVAAALQENGRAPLVGTTTYGKGSVQLIFELSDGSSLHVTSARWLTPDGETLDGVGLQPDIAVDPATEVAGPDPYLAAAAEWLLTQVEVEP